VNPSTIGNKAIPTYTVSELNEAIGVLLDRGFAPRFLLEATVSRPQLKKGHLWLSLNDGRSSIGGVIWASQLRKLSFVPEEGDGVVVVGKLNFWATRGNLSVQILDVRPSLTSVLRQFERVRTLLAPEGLFDPARKRPLPPWPQRVALLTSVPSSALADMLRTARDRWPVTDLLVVPIPVQGSVEAQILAALEALDHKAGELAIDAMVLARGGGSREDLAVFDGESLARALAKFPVPVVCGLGHEDDTTIADLVADHRASTPTAALVALLPERRDALRAVLQSRRHLRQLLALRLESIRHRLERLRQRMGELHPSHWLERKREWLLQQKKLLTALSPLHLLERGFSILQDGEGNLVRSVTDLRPDDAIAIQIMDGQVLATVNQIQPGNRALDITGPEGERT
jgi:exodeoxyribonuclease VII large subunit